MWFLSVLFHQFSTFFHLSSGGWTVFYIKATVPQNVSHHRGTLISSVVRAPRFNFASVEAHHKQIQSQFYSHITYFTPLAFSCDLCQYRSSSSQNIPKCFLTACSLWLCTCHSTLYSSSCVILRYYIILRNKQDRQCTYNVTLRGVHESTLAVESSKCFIFLWVCVSVRACTRARGRVHARACM